jgi:hypothetical protein
VAWPLKLRATSFVVVIGVVLMESAIALIPVGLALWIFTRIDAARLFRDLTTVAFVVAIAIAIQCDLGRQGYRKWWSLRA